LPQVTRIAMALILNSCAKAYLSRLFAIVAALLLAHGAAAASPTLTPDDVATLRAAAADATGASQEYVAGNRVAESIGEQGDARALVPLLLQLRDPRLMESFKSGRLARWHYRAPELEDLAVEVSADATYDDTDKGRRTRQLLFDVIAADYNSAKLFQAVQAIDKRALLAHRANPGGQPPVLITGYVGMLAHYKVPGREGPIAALVPLFDDACDADSLINVLVGHPEVVALGPMRDLYLRSRVSTNSCAQSVARVLVAVGTRGATEALIERLHRLLMLPVSPPRDDEIRDTIWLLGPIRADAQIDLAAVKSAVLAAPLGRILRLNASGWMDQAIAANKRARTYTSENLAYWVGQAHYDIVWDFLSHGVDVNPTDKTWGTPLARALYPTGVPDSRGAQALLVDTLLARGARVSEPESDGSTPLDYAAAFWSLDEVRLLVEHGADVNARFGKTCNAAAFWAGQRSDTVLYLLDRGADINARNCKGHTLLLDAVSSRNFELARRLIDRNADVTLGTGDGLTPLLVAHIRDEPKDRELAKLLRMRGAILNPLAVAVWRTKEWLFLRGYP